MIGLPLQVMEYLNSSFENGLELDKVENLDNCTVRITLKKEHPQRDYVLTYKHNKGVFVKLYAQRCSYRPTTCDRCGKPTPSNKLIDVANDKTTDVICEQCRKPDEKPNCIVEWGWSDLFGEEGVRGEG